MWTAPQRLNDLSGGTQFNIRGDSYAKIPFHIESQKLVAPEHLSKAVHLKAKDVTITTECNCHKSLVSIASIHGEITLAERLWNGETSSLSTLNLDDHCNDDRNEEGEELNLDSLLSTLKNFSKRNLSLHQIASIARLARSYKGQENVTRDQINSLHLLLECTSSPIQIASLIVLSKCVLSVDTSELLFKHHHEVLDCLLNFASDPTFNEAQIFALKVIEQISKHQTLLTLWEQQLEDIVYPLIFGLIKSSNASEITKKTCISILKNISHIPCLITRIKQDILSLLKFGYKDSKGVYLDILQKILETHKQKISPDVLETCLLPALTFMLSSLNCQAQTQALRFLTHLAVDKVTRGVVLQEIHTVGVCIYLSYHSLCRKVIAGTESFIQEILNTKISTEAKQFMLGLSESVIVETENDTKLLNSAGNKRLQCSECQLWKYFDNFVDHLVMQVEKHGCLEKHENTSRFKCELSMYGNINSDQLTIIASSIGCLNNICSWPLHRPKSKQCNIYISDEVIMNEDLRNELQQLKHNQAFTFWEKCGAQIMALCRHFVARMKHLSQKAKDNSSNSEVAMTSGNAPINSQQFLCSQQLTLINMMLRFLLYMSVTSSIITKKMEIENKSEHHKEESAKRRLQRKLAEKEELAEKRLLRRQLVEEGLFYVMGQLIQLENIDIKILCTTIIRLCLQQTDPNSIATSAKIRQRSQSANIHRPQRVLPDFQTAYNTGNPQVFNDKVRPHSSLPATIINKEKWASSEPQRMTTVDSRQYGLFTPLTPRTQKIHLHKKSNFSKRKGMMAEQYYQAPYFMREKSNEQQSNDIMANVTSGSIYIDQRSDHHLAYLMSPLDAGHDIISQCCDRILISSAADILKGILSTDLELKKSSLFLLLDLVQNGQNHLHMELSKLGCIPKLISFMRINDNDESLEITGLTVTKLLLESDRRICQLFNFHGGSQLLMALLQNKPTDALKDVIASTLHSLNFMIHSEDTKDPSKGPADIWGHIMQRWKEEDKVVDVLKQFL